MRLLDLRGTRIAVHEHGQGRPLLCVHGFPLEGALWGPVGERLASRGIRVIAPDLRGFGASAGPSPTDLGVHADDLVGVLDALGLEEPVAWAGFSMGGYVAFEAWRRHASRFGALVLLDTRAEADDEAGRAQREATAVRVEREGSDVVASAMLPKLFAPSAPAPLREAWRARMAAVSPATVAAALRAMAARRDATPDLPRLLVPTLVVVGEHDSITPKADAEAMDAALPNARLEVVAGAGHMTLVERPEVVAGHLGDFLAAHPGRPGDVRRQAP